MREILKKKKSIIKLSAVGLFQYGECIYICVRRGACVGSKGEKNSKNIHDASSVVDDDIRFCILSANKVVFDYDTLDRYEVYNVAGVRKQNIQFWQTRGHSSSFSSFEFLKD